SEITLCRKRVARRRREPGHAEDFASGNGQSTGLVQPFFPMGHAAEYGGPAGAGGQMNGMKTNQKRRRQGIASFTSAEGKVQSKAHGFSFPDFLVVVAALALLVAVALPFLTKARARTRQAQCEANLGRVSGAVLNYAQSEGRLPGEDAVVKGALWWFYKELVKGDLGLKGPSSPADKVFGCPDDRGYEEGKDSKPFRLNSKFDYGSYVFNGVNVPGQPGMPNIAGRALSTIKEPGRTLL